MPFSRALAAAANRYNLLLITIDTLRPDRLSCYDASHLKTPNIDKLAEKGVVFTRAFAHNPLTLPSHANILLGLTPLRHGVHDNGFFKVPPSLPNLATYLKDNGYSCGAFIGAFPLDSRFGLNKGFDVYDQSYGAGTGLDFKFAERKAEAWWEVPLTGLKIRASPGSPGFIVLILINLMSPRSRLLPNLKMTLIAVRWLMWMLRWLLFLTIWKKRSAWLNSDCFNW